MSYESTVLEAWKKHYLFSALVELTYRCNLDCYFCYNDLELAGEPLRFSDYERLFEELSELGCLHLTLSGGEPLAHSDFFSIGAKARELGFVVRVKSNGHALGGERLHRLKREIDPFVVELSLHGAAPDTHDRQTRVPGSFTRLLQNLTEMRSVGLRVKLNCTLTRWNEHEIEGMFEVADRFDLPLSFDPEVTPRDNGDLSPLDITVSPDGIRRLAEIQTRRAAARRAEVRPQGDGDVPSPGSDRHCGAGASAIAIDPFGTVYPCVQWRRPLGNLQRSSLKEIWMGNARLAEIRRLTVEAKTVLKNYPSAELMGFCPGVAEMLTGDPLSVPEGTAQRGKLLSDSLPLHPVQQT